MFKVGDRVRYHHAGHVGWFATVAKVCDGDCEYEFCTAHERKEPVAKPAPGTPSPEVGTGGADLMAAIANARPPTEAEIHAQRESVARAACATPRQAAEIAKRIGDATAPAPVCSDCGKGPAKWMTRPGAVLCEYCAHRIDLGTASPQYRHAERGPGIARHDPEPVVYEDGESWALPSWEEG